MKISVIVAMGEDRAIGQDNQLLWHHSEDLKRFKAITMGHPIIMGRKTFESIGKVLPGRQNIIITRQKSYQVNGAAVCHDINATLRCCDRCKEVFIIGGAQIYQEFMARVNRIYLTLIHRTYPDADTFFPEFNKDDFQETSREKPEENYSYIMLDRKQ
jgi:dihydrofolate reductase